MTEPLIWGVMESVRDTVLNDHMPGFMSIAGLVACIMAAISVLLTTRDYIRGSDLDLWDVCRPVIIMLLVCNFSDLVLMPVDAVTKIASRTIVEEMGLDSDSYVRRWGEDMARISMLGMADAEQDYQEELEEIAEDKSAIGRFFSKAGLAVKKVVRQMFGVKSLTVAGMVGGILFVIVKVLLFVQQLVCEIFLTISALIGAFTLALQILPSFSGSFRSWVARYVQISMWIPVGYIIMGLNLWIAEAFCTPGTVDNLGLGMEWLMITLQLMTLVCIASVPKIAAWIIESSGANDAHGAMSAPARAVARKILKI